MDAAARWERIYRTRSPQELSWYEPMPASCLAALLAVWWQPTSVTLLATTSLFAIGRASVLLSGGVRNLEELNARLACEMSTVVRRTFVGLLV